jgi:hypothetical protein
MMLPSEGMNVPWKPFSFEVVGLATLDDKIGGDSGVVYSTSPKKAIGADDESYIVKGPDPEVTFAELAGCILANAVGITVPTVRACKFANLMLAGSREVSNIRVVEPWLGKPNKVVNYSEIFSAIVVDVWLGNTDRNMGNVIGSSVEKDKIEFVFIDFEKSATLRRHPLILATMIEPRQLWPSNQLGNCLNNCKLIHPPSEMINRIEAVDAGTCRTLLEPVVEALNGIDWAENSIESLMRRASKIRELAEEVWMSKA